MTTTFYAPPERFRDGTVTLPDDEARHAVRALRHSVGDEVVVVDGAGGRFIVRLTVADKRGAAGEVVAERREVGEPTYRLTVGLGTLKNAGRFETFVEKAVELGVSRIVPLSTERTERERLKERRLEGLLIAAMKQSGRSRRPELADVTEFDAMIRSDDALRILCHESADAAPSLPRLLTGAPASLTVIIGPEGGFSEAEVDDAESLGWAVASLGPRRLRAETAAIAAAGAVMLHFASDAPLLASDAPLRNTNLTRWTSPKR